MSTIDLKTRRETLLAIAIPIIIQNIVQNIMLLTDRAFLGHLDARYLSVVGNVMFPYNGFTYFFFSISTGLTILIAQNIGSKNYNQVQRLGESAFFYSTLFSTGLSLIWLLAAKFIFIFFGVSGEILRDAVTFVRIIAVYLIFFGIDCSICSVLQGSGFTKPIMFFGVIKSILNVILDWLLIYGNLGFPALGLKGAALATLVANIIGTGGLVTAFFLNQNLPFRLSKKALLKPKWELYRDTLKVGLPCGLEAMLWYAGQLVLVRLLNQLDGMAVGIYTLVNGIQGLASLLYTGIAKAALTMVGQNWGEQDFNGARNNGLYCQKVAYIVSLAMGVFIAVFAHSLAGIFTSDAQIIDRAVPLLRLTAVYINGQVLNIVIGHAIRATGDTRWMLYSQILGTVFVISLSSVMIFGLSLGLFGMYLTMVLDEFIRGVINFIRFYEGVNPIKKIRAFGYK